MGTAARANVRAKHDFQDVFRELRQIMKPYERLLTVEVDKPGRYGLNGRFNEKYKKVIWFGGVHLRKSYVSYHLIPVYAFPDLLHAISAELRTHMQGKSCFNFKTSEAGLFTEIAGLTKRSFERFKKEGFV